MRNTLISASSRLHGANPRASVQAPGRHSSGICAGRRTVSLGGVTLSVRVTERVTETDTARVTEAGVLPRGRAQELEIRSTCGCCRWVGVWGREFTPCGGQAAAPRARLAARPPRNSPTDLGKLRPRHRPVMAARAIQTPHAPVPLRCSRRPIARNRPAFALCGPGSHRGARGVRTTPMGSQEATQAATTAATSQQEGPA